VPIVEALPLVLLAATVVGFVALALRLVRPYLIEPYALLEEGDRLLRNGKCRLALRAFRIAAGGYERRMKDGDAHQAVVPNAMRCYALAGQCLYLLSRYDEALTLLRRGVDLAEAQRTANPVWRCAAHRFMGQALRMKGNWVEADEFLSQAATEASALPSTKDYNRLERCEAPHFFGDFLLDRGRLAEAEAWLEKAVKAASYLPEQELLVRCTVLRSMGWVLLLRGKQKEAEPYLRQGAHFANLLPPRAYLDRCTAFRALGDLLLRTDRPDEAEKWLRLAVDAARAGKRDLLPGAVSKALTSWGRLLVRQGRTDEAIVCLRRAVSAADETPPDYHADRANARRELGVALLLQELGTASCFAGEQGDGQGGRAEAQDSAPVPVGAPRRLREGLGFLRSSYSRLLAVLGGSTTPGEIAYLLESFGPVDSLCLLASEGLWLQSKDRADLWRILDFADVAKCVSIREGLRRHGPVGIGGGGESSTWRAGSEDWRGEFDPRSSQGTSSDDRRAIRGAAVHEPDVQADPILLELPQDAGDPRKRLLCEPMSVKEIDHLLPDVQTVLVVFSFRGDDLIAIPIRKERTTGGPTILHERNGLFRIAGAKGVLRQLARVQSDALDYLRPDAGLPAGELLESGMKEDLYRRLYEALRLGDLLALIEGGGADRSDLHLILVPDGLLYQFPLHAAFDAGRKEAFYEQVASLRCVLSLRTLELQQEVERERSEWEAADRRVRGMIFANSNRDGRMGEPMLPHARHEVEALIGAGGQESWMVHGDLAPLRSLREAMKDRHHVGNLLWIVGHGNSYLDEFETRDGRHVRVRRPGVLLCDGPVTDSRMVAEGYDFRGVRLLHFACCLLGKLREEDRTKDVEGFIASLTLLGARRVVAAMWPISDLASAAFAGHWAAAIRRNVFDAESASATPATERPQGPPSPHAFAVAFKEAMDTFRKQDDGFFDHEYYWAGYTFYGLG
jgi:tetratricopeptide (TPR) repeat protein